MSQVNIFEAFKAWKELSQEDTKFVFNILNGKKLLIEIGNETGKPKPIDLAILILTIVKNANFTFEVQQNKDTTQQCKPN